MALFRYGLIAALIQRLPDKGSLEGQLRQIAAGRYTIPYSARTSVGVSTLRRYLKTYQGQGFEGLLPKPRRDMGVPRAFDPQVLARAIALREQAPGRTTPMLVEILAREGQPALKPHTLDTHLRKAGKTRRVLRQAPETHTRFERDHPNALWQSDAMAGPWLPDPAQPERRLRTHLFAFIDDYSRLIPYGEFFFDEALPRLERVLKLSILRRGLPEEIYVDNGQVFHATQFYAACASLRIRVLHARPYHPQGKGKIEKFWQNVQLSFLPEVQASNITDLATLNASFHAWLDQIYHAHVHSETGQTPFERFTASLDTLDLRTADAEQLRLAFLWRVQRKVSLQGTLKFQGNTYQVDAGLRGQTIELRFDPFDLSRMDIHVQGKCMGTASVIRGQRLLHLHVERLVPPALRNNPAARTDFLATLRDEHTAALRAQLGTLQFAKLTDPNHPDSPSPQE
jgi:transposase InsO family protein